MLYNIFIEYAPLEMAEQARNLSRVFNNFAVFYNVAADVPRLIGDGFHSGISVRVIISH